MKLPGKLALGALIAIGIYSILTQLVVNTAKCNSQLISSVPSPNGQRTAAIYWSECKPDHIPQWELRLTNADSGIGTTFGPFSNRTIKLAWADDANLVVSVPPEIDKPQDLILQGVSVKFRQP
jgi:hypothetical protein